MNPCKAKLVELPEQYKHSSANIILQGSKEFILLQTS
jgi:hypothetical protein